MKAKMKNAGRIAPRVRTGILSACARKIPDAAIMAIMDDQNFTGSPTASNSPHESWMRMALELARKGHGKTIPNPAVGAVLVKNGQMLASGWHRAAGQPHAEIEALHALKNPADARGATLYVTLEPCCTHGRTPPCTDAIVAAGIAQVVYGATDPNPKHNGRAREILQAAGIRVTSGVLEKECTALNREWNHFIRMGMPWVILKAAQSLDGRITPPPPNRIVSSDAAREDAMKLRASCDAVLIGGATLRTDRPLLTVRGISGTKQPLRVVWTRDPSNLPRDAEFFSVEHEAPVFISTARDFPGLCKQLAKEKQIVRLLVEGGGVVHGAAADARLVNEVVIYTAPVVFGGGVPTVRGSGADCSANGLKLELLQVSQIGTDLKIHAVVVP